MIPLLVILGLLLIVVFIAWLDHNRHLQQITSIYKDVADQAGGVVETGGLSLHPRMRLKFEDVPLIISHAYTGTLSNKTSYYSYVQFSHLERSRLKFRMYPTFRMNEIEDDLIKKELATTGTLLDGVVTIKTNRSEKMGAVLTPEVIEALLAWIHREDTHKLQDIHNYEDKFVFGVAGIPEEHQVYTDMIRTAKLILDAYLAAN